MRPKRRAFLAGASAAALAPPLSALAPFLPAAAQDAGYKLVAGPGRVNIAGGAHPDTDAWTFNGTVPGPVLRVRQGGTLRIAYENLLPEESTVHWHGIRLPNAMDGVPHLTQPPVPPGGTFRYEFRVPDAGTFWYHPHANSSAQLGRGLYGALVVEETEPPFCDRDEVWVLSDFRLDRDARVTADFANLRDASHAGRIGNTVAVNGRVPESFAMRAGERLRLRLVNAANARIFRLRFEGHAPVVIALDGHPVSPHGIGEGLVLGPGMRADLMIDAVAKAGSSHRVLDDWTRDSAYRLLDLVYAAAPLRDGPTREPVRAPAHNAVPEPDLAAAERLRLDLDGGAMSRELQRATPEERRGIGERMRRGGVWTLNGAAMTGHSHAHEPMFRLKLGRSYVIQLRNYTAWHHPIHLHGVAFRVVGDARRAWRDTVLLAPNERMEIAFVADNPGDWMLHCHILEHQAAGMMATMRIE